ncbi:hypothetical protein COV20_01925 [Candidatus Woesearchaeota archaeon CG10_big_fil_rev_8_21_14_0_10_45_16]|nr:MAG: hypothetical protein COV20_01925 [Candidatus Woesearchaeota archaeon CG10_big_fil_rev_8_21_14_0_10_45_16]
MVILRQKVALTESHVLEAREEAKQYLAQLDDSFFYHRQGHTFKGVVPAAEAIAKEEKLSEQEIIIVTLAALFHDTGYTQKYLNNEIVGAAFAERYMKSSPLPYSLVQLNLIKKAILCTNLNNKPKTIHEKILRDADLSPIGKKGFFDWMKDLQKESLAHPESELAPFAKEERRWLAFEIDFLEEKHRWLTKGAKKLFETQKQENIKRLKKLYAKHPYSREIVS